MATATETEAHTVAPFTFEGSDFFMLGWCGLKPTQERLIPPVWRHLKADTTKTGKKDILAHILDPLKMGDE